MALLSAGAMVHQDHVHHDSLALMAIMKCDVSDTYVHAHCVHAMQGGTTLMHVPTE